MAIGLIAPQCEQRREPRYRPRRRTACFLRRGVGNQTWQATIRNVSSEGIGLIVNQAIKTGMLLAVQLPGKEGPDSGIVKMIKVTHAIPQPGGTWWVAGGIFASKLSTADLRGLVVG